MNAGAPTCSTCGGLNTNPQLTKCHFCGSQLAPPAPPPGYGAAPGYGLQPYGAPPGYGPQPGYGAPPGYGPPPGYGAPPPGGYGQPAPPGYGVHGFGGAQPFHYAQPPVNYANGLANGLTSGWSTFFWIRLGIAAVAIGVSLLGACVSALSH